MKKYILSFIVLPLSFSTASAQKEWSLRECCDYAVEHNISIKQQQNQCRQKELQLSTAKNSRLPDLSGSLGQNFSFGRGLTAENTYTNTNTSNTSLQLSTSVPIFTGFQIPNQIKLSQLNLEAATADLEKAKNDIRMQVAKAYVQILYDMPLAVFRLSLIMARLPRQNSLPRSLHWPIADSRQHRLTIIVVWPSLILLSCSNFLVLMDSR